MITESEAVQPPVLAPSMPETDITPETDPIPKQPALPSLPAQAAGIPSTQVNITSIPSTDGHASPAIQELPGNLPAPINLSDVIAQTDVELRRLNWSVTDGRDYLTHTYGKRSRHDLTDEELLAFLLHLEALPTPSSV